MWYPLLLVPVLASPRPALSPRCSYLPSFFLLMQIVECTFLMCCVRRLVPPEVPGTRPHQVAGRCWDDGVSSTSPPPHALLRRHWNGSLALQDLLCSCHNVGCRVSESIPPIFVCVPRPPPPVDPVPPSTRRASGNGRARRRQMPSRCQQDCSFDAALPIASVGGCRMGTLLEREVQTGAPEVVDR